MAAGIECALVSPPGPVTRYPYLGIAQLAAVLRERGMRVAIVDSTALRLEQSQVVEELERLQPRVVGVTVMSAALPSAWRLLQELRRRQPQAALVVGGAHVDGEPSIVQHIGADYGPTASARTNLPTSSRRSSAGAGPERCPD